MAKSRAERIASVISALNAVAVGELAAIETRVQVAYQELCGLDAPELADVLRSASAALGRGDLGNFRRLIAQTVSRLGHLR